MVRRLAGKTAQCGCNASKVPFQQGAIAKWLRRQIRNLFLFEGAGSNPAGVGIISNAVFGSLFLHTMRVRELRFTEESTIGSWTTSISVYTVSRCSIVTTTGTHKHGMADNLKLSGFTLPELSREGIMNDHRDVFFSVIHVGPSLIFNPVQIFVPCT